MNNCMENLQDGNEESSQKLVTVRYWSQSDTGHTIADQQDNSARTAQDRQRIRRKPEITHCDAGSRVKPHKLQRKIQDVP